MVQLSRFLGCKNCLETKSPITQGPESSNGARCCHDLTSKGFAVEGWGGQKVVFRDHGDHCLVTQQLNIQVLKIHLKMVGPFQPLPRWEFLTFPDSLPQCLATLTVKMLFLLSRKAAQMLANSRSLLEGWTRLLLTTPSLILRWVMSCKRHTLEPLLTTGGNGS